MLAFGASEYQTPVTAAMASLAGPDLDGPAPTNSANSSCPAGCEAGSPACDARPGHIESEPVGKSPIYTINARILDNLTVF